MNPSRHALSRPAREPAQRSLIGACFTHEYSIEAAALCNPSMVLQSDAQESDGSARFVMSVRRIGEGHRSSIGFRTGRITADGQVTVHDPSAHSISVSGTPGLHYRSVLHAKLDQLGDDSPKISQFVARRTRGVWLAGSLALGAAGTPVCAADRLG